MLVACHVTYLAKHKARSKERCRRTPPRLPCLAPPAAVFPPSHPKLFSFSGALAAVETWLALAFASRELGGPSGNTNVFVPGFMRVEPDGNDWVEWEIALSRYVLMAFDKKSRWSLSMTRRSCLPNFLVLLYTYSCICCVFFGSTSTQGASRFFCVAYGQ